MKNHDFIELSHSAETTKDYIKTNTDSKCFKFRKNMQFIKAKDSSIKSINATIQNKSKLINETSNHMFEPAYGNIRADTFLKNNIKGSKEIYNFRE